MSSKRPKFFTTLIAILSVTGVITVTAFNLYQNNKPQDKYFSDIERVNLLAVNQFYSMRQQPNEFMSVRSSVRDWADTPNKMYGIEFMTSSMHYNRISFQEKY